MPGSLKNQLPFTSASEAIGDVLDCLAQLTPENLDFRGGKK